MYPVMHLIPCAKCTLSPAFDRPIMALSPSPWLAMAHTKTSSSIKEFTSVWDHVHSQSTVIAVVGRRAKSDFLRQNLQSIDGGVLAEPHGQVFLWPDPTQHDTLFIDYEFHHPDNPASPDGPCVTRVADWHGSTDGPFTRRRVGNLILGQALGPVCHVICYFAADVGAIRPLASLLAANIMRSPTTDLSSECLPQLLIVVETTSMTFDEHACETSLLEMIFCILRSRQEDENDVTTRAHLNRCFSHLRVVGIRSPNNTRARSRQIRTRLMSMARECRLMRSQNGVLFSADHVRVFAGKLLDHFCTRSDQQFSFISSSRALDFTLHDFRTHLDELLSSLPSQIWIWHVFIPLMSSAIVLACYPPGSHSKSPF